jgi:UDP-glucose 4-epimerase
VTVDDLRSGDGRRSAELPLVVLDLAGPDAVPVLTNVLREQSIDTVMHTAARKRADESVALPEWYYQQNVAGLANVLLAMRQAGVARMVYSSSAAVYGTPPDGASKLAEHAPCRPENPYGMTKLVGERMCADAEKAWELRWIALRYFNVGGAGWDDLAETSGGNLIPAVVKAVADGGRPKVFGTDFETPDGTGVRDYVHVMDVAEAHASAVEALASDPLPPQRVFNIGTGRGSSVFEVLRAVEEVSGVSVRAECLPRRAGDPPTAVADTTRAAESLRWSASRSLHDIVESTWRAALR